MNYISPRTRELIEILDKALNRLNLKTHSSSKLRKSVPKKEELEDFLGKAWDLYTKNIKEGLEKEILLKKYTAPTKLSTPLLSTDCTREKHGRSRELSDLTTDDENDHQSSKTGDGNQAKENLKKKDEIEKATPIPKHQVKILNTGSTVEKLGRPRAFSDITTDDGRSRELSDLTTDDENNENPPKDILRKEIHIENSTPIPKHYVTILNTGSTVEKLGRPRAFSDITMEDENVYPFPETENQNHPKELLKSDHDLMFVLEDLVIHTKPSNQTKYSLEIESTGNPGAEHFVKIYKVCKNKRKGILKNKTANDYISKVVYSAFFTNEKKQTSRSKRLLKLVQKKILKRRSHEPPQKCTIGITEECTSKNTEDKTRRTPEEYASIDIHQEGPSVNMKVTKKVDPTNILFECDFLLALPLDSWPQAANEWITRTRKWPAQEVVQELSKEKCYVIPKPKFPEDEEFWRISFSKQEVLLSERLPDRARHLYLRMKLDYKTYIKNLYPELKSYHLKTAFFWWMEEQDPSLWETNEVTREELFSSLNQKLLSFVATGFLPHYFIRTVNLHCMPPGMEKFGLICQVTHISKAWINKIRERQCVATVNRVDTDSCSIQFSRRYSSTQEAARQEKIRQLPTEK